MKQLMLVLSLVCTGLVVSSPPAQAVESNLIKGAFGANIHLRQRIPEADWETAMQKAENIEVQWGREEFNWDVIEPSDDMFQFDTYDAVVDSYEAHGIKMVGLLAYSSSWASDNPASPDSSFYPPDLPAWENYVETVAEHYQGRVEYWEIWNEPNEEGFWKGDINHYAQLITIASDAIRRSNPDAKIVLGGLSGSDADYLATLYEEIGDPDVIDVVAIHPYRVINGDFSYAPERARDGLNTLVSDLYNIKSVVRSFDRDSTPIWLTEIGWTTYKDGVSRKRQSRLLMRTYALALAVPEVKKIFWYSLTDSSSNTTFAESNFGLFDYQFERKVAAEAFEFSKRHLHRRYFKDLALPGEQLFDDFAGNRGWEFRGTVCTDGAVERLPEQQLKVTYSFTGLRNCYAPLAIRQPLPDETRAIRFRLKGSNDGTTVRVRITDKTGETFQYGLSTMPGQWLDYTVQLSGHRQHWNGNNDGKLDRPLTFDSIVLDDEDGSLSDGTILLDDVYTSTVGRTYQYRFHKDNKDIYAYWSTAKKKTPLDLFLPGAGRMRVERFLLPDIEKTSGNGHYTVRRSRTLKYLQTL